MNCPSCGAPLRVQEGRDAFVCEYCSAVYRPEKNEEGICVLGEPSETQCPVCQVPLVAASMLRQGFLYCTRCRGSLIAMPVFVSLVEELRARGGHAGEAQPAPDPRELERRLHCPKCGGVMDTHYYAGGGNVIIDDCSRCELNWLDAGELQTIGSYQDHAPEDSGYWSEEHAGTEGGSPGNRLIIPIE
jgi:Zn-finger nucleic acid-binding protein